MKSRIIAAIVAGLLVGVFMTRGRDLPLPDRAKAACRGEIKSRLKNPEGVEFGRSTVQETAPGEWRVYREFKALNGFGVMTPAARTCTLKQDGGRFVLRGLS